MNNRRNKARSLIVRFLLTAWLFAWPHTALAQEETAATKATPEFSVHEWGVFTIPRGADWAKQDMLLEWQSFPKFFHGTMPGRLVKDPAPMIVLKPVLFFHCKEELNVDLLVRFTEGQPLIWWPPTTFPSNPLPEITSHLPASWKDADEESLLLFETRLNGPGHAETVAEDHWVAQLRKVESANVSVIARDRLHRGGDLVRHFSESFVYYDGLFKPPKSPVVTRTDDGISIESDSDHDWLDVLVIDRKHGDGSLSIGKLKKISQGKQATKTSLLPVNFEELKVRIAEFKKTLVAAGLNDDEAQSLLDVWSIGLFQQSGMTLIYRVPQETYDKWIPLHFRPLPKELKRVGLVVHKHLEPDLEGAVMGLIDQLGSNEYQIRQAADQKLHEIGGAAVFYLRKAAKSDDVETAARANRLLEILNNQELLDEVMTRFQEPKRRERLDVEKLIDENRKLLGDKKGKQKSSKNSDK